MKKPLLWLLGLELAYWVPARLLVHFHPQDSIPRELAWTAIRLVSATLVYFHFRKSIWPVGEQLKVRMDNVVVVSGAAFVLMAGLTQDYRMPYPTNVIYALTSLVVGLREEMVYRGVLQRVLTGWWGLPAALVVSNIFFVFYHFGTVPFTTYNVFQFFAAGTILGLIYYRTNSLLCVAALHAAYDAIECFTPLIHPPLALSWGVAILVVILVVLAGTTAGLNNQREAR